jgi:hypothetical protein
MRLNIQKQAQKLKLKAKILNNLDWTLFVIGVVCMVLTGMRVDYPIAESLSLIQLFGVIALFSKGIERGLSMTKVAKNTMVASSMMEVLLREISAIEIEFYDPDVDHKELAKNVKQKIEDIWEEFDHLGLESFIQPDIGDQVAASQRNLNISIQMSDLTNDNKDLISNNNNSNVHIKIDSNDNVAIDAKK